MKPTKVYPLTRIQEWFVVIIASTGMFLSTLDTGIINVALPFFKAYFHTTTNTAALTVTGYATSLAIFIMFFGVLSDQKGKLRIATLGMGLFMTASLLCGLANNITLIILFRVIQGIGAAALQATSASLVTTLIQPARQNRAIGTVGIMIGLGPVLGPSLGGILLALGSWRLIFLINVPFTLIGIICAAILNSQIQERTTGQGIDYWGFIVNAIFIVSLLGGLNVLEKPAERLSGVVLLGVAGITAFILFKIEHHRTTPLIDMTILTRKVPLILLTQTMLFGFASTMIFLLPPFLFENIMHVNTGITGLLVLGAPVGIAIFSKITGNINDGTRNRTFILSGIGIMLISFIVLLLLPPTVSPVFITLALFIYGSGGGFFQPANITALMHAVGFTLQGSMSALQRMTQNIAIALGSSVGSLIMVTNRYHELTGIRISYLITLILIVLVLIISWQTPRQCS
ncbi:MFS transporter [Ligilactobacillus sp. LYQ112]|uniref:MFS transporter n=1 Tax=Ligilactobacillus sp. LYQ112 TaxID=3391060 RepID=UPI003983875A